jgi:hypothetical protein
MNTNVVRRSLKMPSGMRSLAPWQTEAMNLPDALNSRAIWPARGNRATFAPLGPPGTTRAK